MPTRARSTRGRPAEAPVLQSPSAVNMGNPHAIFWVADVNAYDLRQIGPVSNIIDVSGARNITLARRRRATMW